MAVPEFRRFENPTVIGRCGSLFEEPTAADSTLCLSGGCASAAFEWPQRLSIEPRSGSSRWRWIYVSPTL